MASSNLLLMDDYELIMIWFAGLLPMDGIVYICMVHSDVGFCTVLRDKTILRGSYLTTT